jgi:hypothetical protein
MTNITNLPRPYTVVLMRGYRFGDLPGWDNEPETDCYVALVHAEDSHQAVMKAFDQVMAADTKDLTQLLTARGLADFGLSKSDYHFVVLFEGFQSAKLYGFQRGPWS